MLPVTYTDSRGKAVTIEKADRILALDVAGTLGTTVYALGLGDRLVGRDVSTGVPALADLPVVTVNGHELNGEAILDLDPDVVLTDYGIGPLEVQLQIEESGIPVVDHERPAQPGRDRDRRSARWPRSSGSPPKAISSPSGSSPTSPRPRSGSRSWRRSDPAQRLRMAFLYIRGTAGVYSWLGKGSGADDLIAALARGRHRDRGRRPGLAPDQRRGPGASPIRTCCC